MKRRHRRRDRIETLTGRPACREDSAPGNPLGETGKGGLRGKCEAQLSAGAASVRPPDFVAFFGFDDEDGQVVQSDRPRYPIGLPQLSDLDGGRAGIDAVQRFETAAEIEQRLSEHDRIRAIELVATE